MKIGIIGCGLIGNKRAEAIPKSYIFACYDSHKQKSFNFSKKYDCYLSSSEQDFFKTYNVCKEFCCFKLMLIVFKHNVVPLC